ncbi:hypothetical protein [uncultured Methylobacterium sp.]|uniref:hypothetical protein n=1 Tax=uncultured Methylobacterium sp. TaxID=157278 RepID=UPI0025943B62|nr:hypothetical protein [uncultured Methylobacterium sp.]
MHTPFTIMRLLDEAGVYFTINRYREESITIYATIAGERVEIDIFEDGHIEYSIFKGNEDVLSDEKHLLEKIKSWKKDNQL